MDWQEHLITLFSRIDKQFAFSLCACAERMSNTSKPGFSDSEAVTVYLWGIMNGYRKLKPIYGYVRNHLKEWFPKLPAYATYIQRLNRLPQSFAELLSVIQNNFPLLSEQNHIFLIGSMSIIKTNAYRSSRAKVEMPSRKGIIAA